jgi:amino acid transporter
MATSDRQLNAPSRARLSARFFDPGLTRCTISSYSILWAGTILFALVALPFAGDLREAFGYRLALAPSGSASMAALIAANNMRAAAIPLLFAILKIRGRGWLAVLGDVVVGASLAVNLALGGLALGSYGLGLLHFLPQWPLEWGGLAVALAGWRRARSGRRDPCELVLLAIAAAILVCLAALVETYAVPQS